MNKKNIIIISIIVTILTVLIAVNRLNFRQNKIESKIINKYHNFPMISLLSTASNNLIVTSGLYKYGDITQDGKINEEDRNQMSLALDYKIQLSEDQIALGDLDGDKTITSTDLNILKEFIKKNPNTSYSSKVTLEYCLSEDDSSNYCKWQDKNEFVLNHDGNYYVFIKQKDNSKISKSYNYNYRAINYDEYIIDDIEPLA